jgi:putative glutamine transport system substrate-binding protein
MKGKKIITMVAVAALSVSVLLTGCGSNSTGTSGSTGSKSAVQAIKDRGVLKAGVKVDVPKFGYKDPGTSKIEGFEVDLVKAVAKKILGDENKVELQAVTAKTRGPLLDSGEVDIIGATFTITEERKKSYDFSEPYFKDGVALMVKKDSGIKTLKDLDGKKIGVAQSATSKQALEAEVKNLGIKVTFSEYSTYPEIKAALDSKRVDAFSVDGAILNGYLDDSTIILDERYAKQEYGLVSKKGNDDLAKVINDTVNEMKKSGELDKLIEKWGIK